jgi:hypothetical protein
MAIRPARPPASSRIRSRRRPARRGGLIASGRSLAETDDDTVRAELHAFLAGDRHRRELRERALATADGLGARRVVAEALG